MPLLCAVARGSLACAALLLGARADPLTADARGVPALVWACAVGNIEIVKVGSKSAVN